MVRIRKGEMREEVLKEEQKGRGREEVRAEWGGMEFARMYTSEGACTVGSTTTSCVSFTREGPI
jgi:hypothetical protein